MVSCVCIKCSKWSDVDKDISFYRIPAIRKDRDETELELILQRRDGYLAAISRESLEINNLDKYRTCSRHFISGKPVTL